MTALFQFRETTESERDIYIFITCKILTDLDFGDLYEVSQRDKELLEDSSSIEALESIDHDYRRGLLNGGDVRPMNYFEIAHPGEIREVDSSDRIRPLVPVGGEDGSWPPAPDQDDLQDFEEQR